MKASAWQSIFALVASITTLNPYPVLLILSSLLNVLLVEDDSYTNCSCREHNQGLCSKVRKQNCLKLLQILYHQNL